MDPRKPLSKISGGLPALKTVLKAVHWSVVFIEADNPHGQLPATADDLRRFADCAA
jgi:hypothetical protein